MGSCELCKLMDGDIKTKLYYQDDEMKIVDCLTCGYGHPMIVFKGHNEVKTNTEDSAIRSITSIFGQCVIRKEPRSMKEHPHWHIIRIN